MLNMIGMLNFIKSTSFKQLELFNLIRSSKAYNASV